MAGDNSARVAVTGATSTIGSLLMPMLRERGVPVQALGRKPPAGQGADSWHFLDLADKAGDVPAIEAATLIHTASLWLLPGWLEKFHARGVRRVIAFSSTSRFTKLASASPYELEADVSHIARATRPRSLPRRCPTSASSMARPWSSSTAATP
jgi:uncharacterized protein YbjT (DUF2867 family)